MQYSRLRDLPPLKRHRASSRPSTGCPSGTYFPPPVRAVQLPKPDGGVRLLGVPTVADRIAQTVVAQVLEQRAEPVFHPDSYGYRPGRSAIDAVGQCRRRCWKADRVIDLDVSAFFDSVSWELVLKAVRAHTEQPWVLLSVRRWLQAPLQQSDGTLLRRDRGTPQGSAVSPVLANLFLHYAFDAWMAREFPTPPEPNKTTAPNNCGCAPLTSPNPPGWSWPTLKRRNNTGSSRIPSHLAHRARPIR